MNRRIIIATGLVALLIAVAPQAQEPADSEQSTDTAAPAPEGGEPEGGYVNTLRWTTASEVDNFGFDIYRSLSEDGPFDRITEQPIPGAGTVDEPQSYVYVDDTIDPTSGYYYYIESISIDGIREKFSPVTYVKPKKPAEGGSEAEDDDEASEQG